MLKDFGLLVGCTACTDASAAIGIVHRQGLGKTRHIDVQYLWVQKDVYDEKLKVVKVGTDSNPADLMTKFLKPELVDRHLQILKFKRADGRAATAPQIMSIENGKGVDYWGIKDAELLVRVHRKPRSCLFTPMKVAGGPSNAASVGACRVTVGRYGDGTSFRRVDDWKVASIPHQPMRREWTGTTTFMPAETLGGVGLSW